MSNTKDGIEYIRLKNSRVLAMVVRQDFDSYDSFPPFLDNDSEKEHLAKAYSGQNFESERRTKAHITDDELPLQIILLNRSPGSVVNPHYHQVTERPNNETRHQIMVCRNGSMKIGVYSKEGEFAGDVILKSGDLILMYEGHRIEFLEENTKAIEIKEGPFPETDEADKVDF
ncbi:MAG: hypothetical protein VX794_06065 [Nitrospinota bacterium]|nr:hypothetical protein [Nitrospinota bacterium]